jgi:hypothetical protein
MNASCAGNDVCISNNNDDDFPVILTSWHRVLYCTCFDLHFCTVHVLNYIFELTKGAFQRSST